MQTYRIYICKLLFVFIEVKILGKPIEILLMEDNPCDVRLTQEALRYGKVQNNLDVADRRME